VARLPGFNPWGRVIEHRQWLVERLPETQFVPSNRLDAEAVLDYGAAIVIVATGAPWATTATSFFTNEPIPGADAVLDRVLTPEQVITGGKAIAGRHVVVYDCQSDHIPLGVARHLQVQGHDVTVATPFSEVGSRAMQDGVGPALRSEIAASGGRTLPGVFLTEFDGSSAVFVGESGEPSVVDCDAVMLLTRRASDDALYAELRADPAALADAGIQALHQIGDCLAPQDLADAVFSGHRLAREIDTPDPAVARRPARA
jgi:dimethylamine/trimethylamine dehydrogenase